MSLLDLSALPEAAEIAVELAHPAAAEIAVELAHPAAAVRETLAREAARPFDLTGEPGFRTVLLRIGQTEHILLIVFHHIVGDAWSFGLLQNEILRLYEAYRRGEGSPLPPLSCQYADYAAWQREWLAGERSQSQLAYWRGQLAGMPELLEMPADHPRPARQSFRGAHHVFTFSHELTRDLRATCLKHGSTMFMLLMTALQVLFSRYSGQEDIVVSSGVNNRNRTELEPLIGCFINIVLLRGDMSGNPSFADALTRMRTTCLDAYTHQDLPFEKIVEDLNPKRDLSYNPLTQAMFVYLKDIKPGP